jgi:hypothetical protein
MAVAFSCGCLVSLDVWHVSQPAGPKTWRFGLIFSAQQEFELEEELHAS